MLARECATLDVASGGRFEIGIGAGWFDRDYLGTGIPFDRGGVRGEVHGVGPVVARELREDRLDVGRDGDEYQPVEREGALAQVVDDGRPAGGAVALAQQVLWRRPAIVVAHVLHD